MEIRKTSKDEGEWEKGAEERKLRQRERELETIKKETKNDGKTKQDKKKNKNKKKWKRAQRW